MEPFNVYILGCGSALPTLRHFASSQVIEIRGKFFMVDCGEGTQIQLRKTKVNFTKIGAIFISHLHGDHCFGLIGLISTFGMLGRTAPLHVYAPKELQPLLNLQLQMFCEGLEYQVVFHGVNPLLKEMVYEDKSLTVTAIPLQHRVPCCGYLFREKPTLPHIRRDMIDCYNIPISQINNIKLGSNWMTSDGEVIPNEQLVTPADAPRSYAYCSDTRYFPLLAEYVKGVNLLYHESTYADDNANRAHLYFHSTAGEAALTAQKGNVGKLILGHYSARYDDESAILEDAIKIFPNVELSNEGKVFNVK